MWNSFLVLIRSKSDDNQILDCSCSLCLQLFQMLLLILKVTTKYVLRYAKTYESKQMNWKGEARNTNLKLFWSFKFLILSNNLKCNFWWCKDLILPHYSFRHLDLSKNQVFLCYTYYLYSYANYLNLIALSMKIYRFSFKISSYLEFIISIHNRSRIC